MTKIIIKNQFDQCSSIDALEARMHRLHEDIADYTAVKDSIRTGFEDEARIRERRERIMAALGATEKDWQDYRWQLANRITTADELQRHLTLTTEAARQVETVAEKYRFAISPYYLSLIDPDNPHCPIRRQAVPSQAELDPCGVLDPMD